MTTLMGFVLNSLKPRVNDPANAKFWLPKLLADMRNGDGEPLLPVKSSRLDLGYLEGQGGLYVATQFSSNWAIFNGDDAAPASAHPYPRLVLSDVSIVGLQNITVTAATAASNAAGYDISLDLVFNKYPAEAGGIAMPQVAISGRYAMTQALQTGTAPDMKSDSITGEGTFAVTLSNGIILAQAAVEITGSGPMRSNAVVLRSLSLDGSDGQSLALDFKTLTLNGSFPLKDDLIVAIKEALDSSEGQSAIIAGASAMLNAPGNLGTINTVVSERTGSVLDGIFGPAPASLPDDAGQKAATPVDQYLFDRTRAAFQQPNSSWYLPLQIASVDRPVLDPYSNARIDVPKQVIKGLTYDAIVITDAILAGASNAIAPLAQTKLALDRFSTQAALGTLAEGPRREVARAGGPVDLNVPAARPLVFRAGFSLTQQGFQPVRLAGRLRAEIDGALVLLTIVPSGSDVDHLELQLAQVSTNIANARIAVAVILDPPDRGLEQVLDTLFGKPEVQSQVLGAINGALSDKSREIAEQLTSFARKAITAQIGG